MNGGISAGFKEHTKNAVEGEVFYGALPLDYIIFIL
jgi:hypothetical protein